MSVVGPFAEIVTIDEATWYTSPLLLNIHGCRNEEPMGGNIMKISELQAKDVVNISDGQKLGQIHDLELDLQQGTIRAIMLPGETKLFGWIASGQEWVIPWRQIVKIGSDVILVRLDTRTKEIRPTDTFYGT
jgi:YlmC/YmxH family sporulation protein